MSPLAQTQLACHSFEAIKCLTCLELAAVCGRRRCSLAGCAFPFASFAYMSFARDPSFPQKDTKNAKDAKKAIGASFRGFRRRRWVAPNRSHNIRPARINSTVCAVRLPRLTSYLESRNCTLVLRQPLGNSGHSIFQLRVNWFGWRTRGIIRVAHLFSNRECVVRANDPETFLATPILLTSIALVAASIAGRRSMKVEPVAVLRVSKRDSLFPSASDS